MADYAHGGDFWSACPGKGGVMLDFSANLNPLGMPEAVKQAARRAIDGAEHYPDPFCRKLAAAIARRDGIPAGWIVCGNGAADLIFRLAFALRPRKALVTAPTFSEYEQALTAVGCTTSHHLLREEENFSLTERILEDLTPNTDILFLCTPNNPTGAPIGEKLLAAILSRCREYGTRLVLDECFLHLSDGGEENSRTGFLMEYPELVLLRAFTKCYAMPGLRLGYCITGDEGLRERLWTCAQPWSVSAVAQAAGLAALTECPGHPASARAFLAKERPFLAKALEELGMKVYPASANYLLFRRAGCTDLKERLAQRGVLIRSCGNYPGLGPDYYRVAVRPHEENLVLIQTLREVL